MLCHRVLRTLQQIARGPASLERETWESLLLFLIGINDALLAPPATREDAGEQLCERVLGVLLEVLRNYYLPVILSRLINIDRLKIKKKKYLIKFCLRYGW